jgi:hypothetical protein
MKTSVHAIITFYGFIFDEHFDFKTIIDAVSIPDFEKKEKEWLEEKKSEILKRVANAASTKPVGIHSITHEAVE